MDPNSEGYQELSSTEKPWGSRAIGVLGRLPEGFKNCSANDRVLINRGWALAHYNLWRATPGPAG
jgi:hypothetical protein